MKKGLIFIALTLRFLALMATVNLGFSLINSATAQEQRPFVFTWNMTSASNPVLDSCCPASRYASISTASYDGESDNPSPFLTALFPLKS